MAQLYRLIKDTGVKPLFPTGGGGGVQGPIGPPPNQPSEPPPAPTGMPLGGWVPPPPPGIPPAPGVLPGFGPLFGAGEPGLGGGLQGLLAMQTMGAGTLFGEAMEGVQGGIQAGGGTTVASGKGAGRVPSGYSESSATATAGSLIPLGYAPGHSGAVGAELNRLPAGSRLVSTGLILEPYPSFLQNLSMLQEQIFRALPPPAPPPRVGADGQAWTEVTGFSDTVAGLIGKELPDWERPLLPQENRAVMDAMTAVVEAAQHIQDVKLKARILDVSKKLHEEKTQGDVRAGSNDPTNPNPPDNWGGITIPSGIPFVPVVIWIHGKSFSGTYTNPCSRDFINLMRIVYHESRHALGATKEKKTAAGTIQALQAVRDTLDSLPTFAKCPPTDRARLKSDIDDMIQTEADYGGLNASDAAKEDPPVSPPRRKGRGE